jgi:hypothetical protein
MSDQEARGGKFLPAFFVEPVALGDEFEAGELPLHMTYFPPVNTRLERQYVQRLKMYINPMEPFMATVGEGRNFGPNEDIHVRTMVHSERLLAVHRKILSVLQYLPHSSTYRTPYNPHITIDETDTRVETGDSIEIGGFSIVEKDLRRGTWQVMAKIGLRGGEMMTDARIIKANNRDTV